MRAVGPGMSGDCYYHRYGETSAPGGGGGGGGTAEGRERSGGIRLAHFAVMSQ